MTKSSMNPKVDWYFSKEQKWQEEIEKLRTIALDCGLNEELKWGCPCYTLQGNNIVLIHVFKDYCAYLFFKGALLSDVHSKLIQQTKNVQAARQVRFTNVKEITKLERALKTYIYEAIEVEKAGLKVELKKTSEFTMCVEFKVERDWVMIIFRRKNKLITKIKMEKRNKIIYWVATGLLSVGMFSSGIMQIMHAKELEEIMVHLGYPTYLMYILGVWKILGVIAILLPGFKLVKEWAYAGLFFTMTGALVSHLVLGDEGKAILGPLFQTFFIVLSWYFRPASRKL